MNSVALAPDVKMEIIEICHKMKVSGLPSEFIATAATTAFEFEGVYDLLKIWDGEDSVEERNEIVADIQGLIDDCNQHEKIEGVYVRFDDLGQIAANIRAFKDTLRDIVDKKGGVTRLAELTGIPQPSVSRFFNSAAMPRRTTLNKFARALGLSQIEISTEWAR
jgi:DNA-binding phage protein